MSKLVKRTGTGASDIGSPDRHGEQEVARAVEDSLIKSWLKSFEPVTDKEKDAQRKFGI